MPHLVQMDKKHRQDGLVIIGDEYQASTAKDIAKVTKKLGITFAITQDSSEPEDMLGIPHAVVLDRKGALAFSGDPADPKFEATIMAALKGEELPKEKVLIASRKWTNTSGVTIAAAVVAIKDEKVRFKLADGRETDFPIAQLSKEDQELIKKTAAELKE